MSTKSISAAVRGIVRSRSEGFSRAARRRWSPLRTALGRAHQAKIDTKRAALRTQLPLKSGLWLFSGRLRLHHWSERAFPAPRNGADGSVVAVARRWRAAVAICPPHWVWIRSHGDGAQQAMRTKGGGLVAIDHRTELVYHAATTPFTTEYENKRNAVATYLPTPHYRIWADRRSLTEALAVGTSFALQPIAMKRQILADLARRSALQSTQSSRRIDADEIRRALERAMSAPSPTWLSRHLEILSGHLSDHEPVWPQVIGHGDITGGNVFVSDDNSWTIIDFEDARRVPHFYDAASLIIRDVDLRRCWFEGDLRTELAPLRAAAASDETSLRVWLETTALIGATHHAQNYGGDLIRTLVSVWPTPEH